MRKTKIFQIYGVAYRSRQHSAEEGSRLLALGDAASPFDRLSGTFAADAEGTFHALDSRESINRYVKDAMAGFIDGSRVLNELIQFVDNFNFGFLNDYKPVKTPRRFRSDIDPNVLEGEDPYLERLIAAKYCSLRELQTFYSTADLHRMLNVLANDNLNNALASEAAHAAARAKRK